MLADGTVFWGLGFGAHTSATVPVGEVCFSTGMTGYQETLTDPSFAGQIITFTFPHIGNVGTNIEDIEAATVAARGLVVNQDITEPSNWRSAQRLQEWLRAQGIAGISGVDTRSLTIRIRDGGAPTGVLAFPRDGKFNLAALRAQASEWPGLEGMDLAKEVTCRQSYDWDETAWSWPTGFGRQTAPKHHVVAVDYGAKRNILRCLASAGCKVTVVPATATAEDILRHRPDGVFLSNGPGDPAAGTRRRPANTPCRCCGSCWIAAPRYLVFAWGISCLRWRWARRLTSWNAVIAAQTSRYSPGPSDSHHLFGRFIGLMELRG
jgi:carbamoyl-phosphate synthase small subunit